MKIPKLQFNYTHFLHPFFPKYSHHFLRIGTGAMLVFVGDVIPVGALAGARGNVLFTTYWNSLCDHVGDTEQRIPYGNPTTTVRAKNIRFYDLAQDSRNPVE